MTEILTKNDDNLWSWTFSIERNRIRNAEKLISNVNDVEAVGDTSIPTDLTNVRLIEFFFDNFESCRLEKVPVRKLMLFSIDRKGKITTKTVSELQRAFGRVGRLPFDTAWWACLVRFADVFRVFGLSSAAFFVNTRTEDGSNLP